MAQGRDKLNACYAGGICDGAEVLVKACDVMELKDILSHLNEGKCVKAGSEELAEMTSLSHEPMQIIG